MILSTSGYIELATREGLTLRPYNDGTGVITIGFGSTSSDISDLNQWNPTKYITIDQAVQYFKQGIQKYQNDVSQHVNVLLQQYQFDALVSICYNIGQAGFNHSTFLKNINWKESDDIIAAAIMLWNKPKMITNRRQQEILLYTQGIYNSNGFVEYEDTDGNYRQLRSTIKAVDIKGYF